MKDDYEGMLTSLSSDGSENQQTSNGHSNRPALGHHSTTSFEDHLEANVVNLQARTDDFSQEISMEKVSSPPSSASPDDDSYSAFPVVRSSSLTFEDGDDDDDDEADLKRYHFNFSADADSGRATLTNSLHGGPAPTNSTQEQRVTALQYLWYSFQLQRQQARQRRAQLLLQQSEDDLRQTALICMNTYCDATDSGILFFGALALLWTFVFFHISDEALKRRWLLLGSCAFTLRISARPLWGYCVKQRQRRRLQSQGRLHPHERLSQQSPAPKQLRQRSHDDLTSASSDRYPISPNSGRYLDSPPKSGNLELQSIPNDTH